MLDREKLKEIPKTPGVYMHKDELGKIIYVGKANNLNSRVRQYFQNSKSLDGKTRALVKNIDDVSYITTASEMEAFILECNLIKKYSPKYNILLKDDKSYPYIKVSMSEEFPRVTRTRTYTKGEDLYFGPYSDIGAVNSMVDFINTVFPTKKCSKQNFLKGERPCLNYHIKKCLGPCQYKVNKKDYKETIDVIVEFLKGKDKTLDKYLEEKMKVASEELRYEDAMKYRNYLRAATAIREKQRVEFRQSDEVDVVLYGGEGKVMVFSVMDNRLVDRQAYRLDISLSGERSEEEMVLEFIKQHYSKEIKGPKQILLNDEKENYNKEEIKMIETYLGEIWGRKVQIYMPQRGEKSSLLKLAMADLMEQKKVLHEKMEKEESRERKLQRGLATFGDFSIRPRIEAYDISHTFGADSVGVEIVFVGTKAVKSQYRKFKVRTKDHLGKSQDDYASTSEVLFRRLKRAIEGEKAFLPLPEIILLDGGKGHLEAIRQILETIVIMAEKSIKKPKEEDTETEKLIQKIEAEKKEKLILDLRKIKLIGMAKDDKHRTSKLVYRSSTGTGVGEILEFDLKGNPMLYSFFGNIQEEVHRYAITYHKSTRNKAVIKSELENIPGIGQIKRNNILNYFGSIKKLKESTREEIAKVPKITIKDIDAICKYFEIR